MKISENSAFFPRWTEGPAVTADQLALVQRPFLLSTMTQVVQFQEAEFGGKAPVDWKVGTYYTGVYAAYLATRTPALKDAAIAWGESANWKMGPRPFYADDLCMGQTMLDAYLDDRNPKYIAHLIEAVDKYFGKTKLTSDDVHSHMFKDPEIPMIGRNLWWWCDALYMAPPVLVRLYAATGEQRYLDLLHQLYWDTVEHLFDEKASLFFRDAGFFPADRQLTPELEKRFWSRGNGWVYAGLVRVLDTLPQSDPQRQRYLDLFVRLTQKLVTLQGADGLWRSWLNRPDADPTPETSGTCFMAFGLLAGVRHGWLDKKTYLPLALNAWRGLVSKLGVNGCLGYAQVVDSAPGAVRPESSIDYTHGAFLLVASELYLLDLSANDLQGVLPSVTPKLVLTDCAWAASGEGRATLADQHLYVAGSNSAGMAVVYPYRINPPNAPAIVRQASVFGPSPVEPTSAALARSGNQLTLTLPMPSGPVQHVATVPAELPGWGPMQLDWTQNKATAPAPALASAAGEETGVVVDPQDPLRAYVTATVHPGTGQVDPSGRSQLFTGLKPSASADYVWEQLTFDARRDNLRPVVPSTHAPGLCVVWMRGDYRCATEFQADLYALGV